MNPFSPSHVSTRAATVQDFLERYEVGETVGVGGELPDRAQVICTRVLTSTYQRSTTNHFPPPTGFAVVKKGKDKASGEPVAIKVRVEP